MDDILDFWDLTEIGVLKEADSCNRSEFIGDISECHEYVRLQDGRVAYICTYRLELNYGPEWEALLGLVNLGDRL